MRGFLRISLAILALAAFQAIAQSDPAASSEAAGAFLKRSEEILKRAHGAFDKPELASERERIEAAERIAKEAQKAHSAAEVIPPAAKRLPPIGSSPAAVPIDKDRIAAYGASGALIFVSTSMPQSELLAALEAGGETGAKVVFRGVRKGETINKTFALLQGLAGRVKTPVDVNVDPRPFEEFGVETVPSVVVYSGADFVKLSGTVSVSHANKLLRENRFGEQGAYGITREIAEPDLLEELKERVARIDWDAKKQGAIDRMWQHIEIKELPHATSADSWLFDPSVTVDAEIRGPDGQLIAPAGARFNPLDIVNFNKTVVAFDATSKGEMEFAKRIADEELAKGSAVVLVTTAIDRSNPWESLDAYAKALFPHRLYFLDDLMATRFGIRATPTVVRAEGRNFRVEQFLVKVASVQ